jgi:hypothetical protein
VSKNKLRKKPTSSRQQSEKLFFFFSDLAFELGIRSYEKYGRRSGIVVAIALW